jgi:S1-C subfamily serine protease
LRIADCGLRIPSFNLKSEIRNPKSTSLALAILLCALTTLASAAAEPDQAVLEAESARVETIAKLSKPTIAIFDAGGQGGGSGVIISSDGYALSNFHVVQATGVAMKCGLSDGRFVDAVLVGLDPGGDVALIKLIGKEDFPAAELGDSDDARVGQWVYVAGNPFLLADDFKPTVTYGILSGVHRYQYPAGTLLEYADCLQTDASINPGNSGGPMFDFAGRLIGINGRGSFEKRGRVNVGVGYAISINQIKRFIGLLRSGRIVDHASLGATVSTDSDHRVVIDDILDNSDAYRRGLRYGDEIVRFGGREIGSANAFKNSLGTYPSGWRVPLTYRRDGKEYETRVRLTGVHRAGELEAMLDTEQEPPVPDRPERDKDKKPGDKRAPEIPGLPKKPDDERKPGAPERRRQRPAKDKQRMPKAVRQYYEESPGYINFWFNRYHQQRVWNAYLAHGDFAETGWNWKISGKTDKGGDVAIELTEKNGTITMPDGKSGAVFGASLTDADALSPPRSGGMLAALHLWQRLLLLGPRRFGEVYYFGTTPWKTDDKLDDCVVTTTAGVESRFYFDSANGHCTGVELRVADDEDPCEIYFDDIRQVDGHSLPFHWIIRQGDEVFADIKVSSYDWGGGKPAKDK